jgi:NAD(P)-binding Rossmann-like domain
MAKATGMGQKIVVIGAGIAGLTAAVALARKGLEVEVYEQAPELKEVGAGASASASRPPAASGRVVWYAVWKAPAEGAGVNTEHLPRLFGSWHEPVRAVIEATPLDTTVRKDVYDRLPTRTWTRGRVALIGDAIHLMTPDHAALRPATSARPGGWPTPTSQPLSHAPYVDEGLAYRPVDDEIVLRAADDAVVECLAGHHHTGGFLDVGIGADPGRHPGGCRGPGLSSEHAIRKLCHLTVHRREGAG